MSKWIDRVYKHLEDYKITVLKINECGYYNDNKYGHILPLEEGMKNYLGEDANNVAKKLKSENKLHTYWYHLNSSQTMCINFFAPLIKNEYLSIFFDKVLELKIKQFHKTEFEYVPENLSTNFDFYVQDSDKKNYYFEIKYTESFDRKTEAKDVNDAFKKYYEKEVNNNELFVKAKITKDDFMLNHFQVYRNIVKANDNNYSILIVMKDNDIANKEIDSAFKALKLNNSAEKHILVLYWQDIVKRTIDLAYDLKNTKLVDYYNEFYRKYLDI